MDYEAVHNRLIDLQFRGYVNSKTRGDRVEGGGTDEGREFLAEHGGGGE